VDGINAIINGINGIVRAVKGVEIVGFKPFGFLADEAIKPLGRVKLAEGGLVTGPTRALIGEAGPELVIPLDKVLPALSRMVQPQQMYSPPPSPQQIMNSYAGASYNNSRSTTINNNWSPTYNQSRTPDADYWLMQSLAI
jgi:hypothetical protein